MPGKKGKKTLSSREKKEMASRGKIMFDFSQQRVAPALVSFP